MSSAEATKASQALARQLSRVVLSHETILRHAHSTLREPELLELPRHASALDLWMAVLQRARAEGATATLVAGVLDENPAAAKLKAAFETWQKEHGQPPGVELHEEPPRPTRPASRSKRSLPLARIVIAAGVVVAAAAMGVVLTSRVTPRVAPRSSASVIVPRVLGAVPGAPSGAASDISPSSHEKPAAPSPASAAHLPPAYASAVSAAIKHVEPTEAELRAALLACWKQTEGADPSYPASSIQYDLYLKGPSGMVAGKSPAFSTSPRFARCARAVADGIWERMSSGRTIRTVMLLPGKATTPPFPSEAEARRALLACWTQKEGRGPGAKRSTLQFRVQSHGGQVWVEPKAPEFLACARALYDEYRRRATLLDELSMTLELPGAGTPAAAASSP